MAVVEIQRTVWDAARAGRVAAMRFALDVLQLGEPAVYSDGAREWYVFSDSRVSVEDAATLGSVTAVLPRFNNWVPPNDRAEAARSVRAQVNDRRRPVSEVQLTEVVQVEVPVRIQIEVDVLDENGDPTGETVLVWVDDPSGATELVDVEQPLGDPYSLVMAAQGVPAWIRMGASVSEGLVPVEGGVL